MPEETLQFMLRSSRKNRPTLFRLTIPGASRVAPIKKGYIDFEMTNHENNPHRSFETPHLSRCNSWRPERLS